MSDQAHAQKSNGLYSSSVFTKAKLRSLTIQLSQLCMVYWQGPIYRSLILVSHITGNFVFNDNSMGIYPTVPSPNEEKKPPTHKE